MQTPQHKTYIMQTEHTAAPAARCALCMHIGHHTAQLPHERVIACAAAAPYADIVHAACRDSCRGRYALLCDYCFHYVQTCKSAGPKRHPLHLSVDCVLSGGCSTPMPNKLQLIRWIGGMDAEHPILLHTRNGELHVRVQALRRLEDAFGIPNVFDMGMISMVRWLFEGAPRVFSDPNLGRNVRRIMGEWSGPQFWNALPCPCRRCRGGGVPLFTSYSSALVAGSAGGLQAEFENVIEKGPVVPGVTFFCLLCGEVSAISYEYDDALKALLDIKSPSFPSSGGYYAHLAATHRKHTSFFFEGAALVKA